MKLALKTVGLLVALDLCSGTVDSSIGRRVASYGSIGSYMPTSLVADSNAIDRDIHAIKRELHFATRTGFRNAERIYREGAYSRPVAELLTTEPIPDTTRIRLGMKVIGLGYGNGTAEVKGTLIEVGDMGDTSRLLISYDVSEDQDGYTFDCQVGGNPRALFDGCFKEEGRLSIPALDMDVGYRYDVQANNLNLMSISRLSAESRKTMHECDDCDYYPMYSKYVRFYGRFDYADHIIKSAFHADKTVVDRGSMDFRIFKETGRSELVIKTMTYMNVWMHVIREMEVALEQCTAGDNENSQETADAWDRAVAFYTGSTQSSDGSSYSGTMIYDAAEKACATMNTCLDASGGTSYVNYHVFNQFDVGQRKLLDGDCEEAKLRKDTIVTLMTIPLIQKTIRYAHMVSHEIAAGYLDERHYAQGTAYALSVLPLVYSCNPDDAKIIHDNLKPVKPSENPSVDFAAVKGAFERNYDCLGVLCSEIGGVLDDDDYFSDAIPCVDSMLPPPQGSLKKNGTQNIKQNNGTRGLLVVLILVGLLVAGLLLYLIFRTFKKFEVEIDTGKKGGGAVPEDCPCPELEESEGETPSLHGEVTFA